jgi:hypothetical protein
VWSSRRGSRQIEHLGSAHDEAELEDVSTLYFEADRGDG